MQLKSYAKENVLHLIRKLQDIQEIFAATHGVADIFSNSKIYEVVIANELGHLLIPGHSGSRDAKDAQGGLYEYKHYKQKSSNHSWTFNDYSDLTIASLKTTKSVVFAKIDDTGQVPVLEWYIEVPGEQCGEYLRSRVDDLIARAPKGYVNRRRMINFSAMQLMRDLQLPQISVNTLNLNGPYADLLKQVYEVIFEIEQITGVSNLLTSNKLWELLVSLELGHSVNPEQGGRAGAHDAYDSQGNAYEYKVSVKRSWQFQDISDNVLEKMKYDEAVILAVVDKSRLAVVEIYSVSPGVLVPLLIQKLQQKEERFTQLKKEVRRLQTSLGLREILAVNARRLL